MQAYKVLQKCTLTLQSCTSNNTFYSFCSKYSFWSHSINKSGDRKKPNFVKVMREEKRVEIPGWLLLLALMGAKSFLLRKFYTQHVPIHWGSHRVVDNKIPIKCDEFAQDSLSKWIFRYLGSLKMPCRETSTL